MVANTGLRLDYSHAGGEWYDYSPFAGVLSNATGLDSPARATKRIVALSPRLGVSFPVTAVSKLYFNYGHFRQLPDAGRPLPRARLRRGAPDEPHRQPERPLPQTVAYELGYEQSFFGQFLVRARATTRTSRSDRGFR